MPWKIFAYFIAAVLFSLLNLSMADRLWRRYNAPYLRSLFFFLVVFDVSSFLNWTGAKIIRLLFAGDGGFEFEKIFFGFYIFLVPLLIVQMYFFLLVFLGLIGKKAPRGLLSLFLISLSALLLYFFWTYAGDYARGDLSRIKSAWAIYDGAAIAAAVVLPSVFLLVALFEKDEFKRRKNIAFIAAFQVVVVVCYLVPLSWLQINLKNTQIDLLAFLYFLMPLLPLWVAEIFHRKSIRMYPAEETLLPMASLIEKFGISPREGEVLEMVLAGKSHKEIESALFISGKTVKSHLYSAYKKLGVKNRVQLLNLRHNLK